MKYKDLFKKTQHKTNFRFGMFAFRVKGKEVGTHRQVFFFLALDVANWGLDTDTRLENISHLHTHLWASLISFIN